LQYLLKQYGLTKKILAYVKDKSANLNIMTIALKSIVSCEALGIMESFNGNYNKHAIFKACQYITVEERVFKGLKYV
jgi:hypothetical protein